MTLNFYTLGVLYLVYSFLGWVGETVVATFRGKRFANRGMAAGPFCFVYGTTAILMAVGFADMRTKPVVLFVACMITATVVEWLTANISMYVLSCPTIRPKKADAELTDRKSVV